MGLEERQFSESIAVITTNIEQTQKLLREATVELNSRQVVIDQYRRTNAAHERMIGKLLELLDNDDLDGARDIVKAEYDSIHGPRD